MYPEPINIWESLEYSSLGTSIAESLWAFPAIETVHVIALITVVGTIAVMDLRLLGLTSRNVPVTQLTRDTLPWTWGGFILAAISGGLLFVSNAPGYVGNSYFLWKLCVIALAGLNMLFFHFGTYRTVGGWDLGDPPRAAKVAGLLSLVFWIVVVFLGRAIGFTLSMFG